MIRVTKEQIREFKKSFIWKDMLRELKLWARRFQKEYDIVIKTGMDDNATSASVLMRVGDIHGRNAAIDYFIQLPDIFLASLEEDTDDDSN